MFRILNFAFFISHKCFFYIIILKRDLLVGALCRGRLMVRFQMAFINIDSYHFDNASKFRISNAVELLHGIFNYKLFCFHMPAEKSKHKLALLLRIRCKFTNQFIEKSLTFLPASSFAEDKSLSSFSRLYLCRSSSENSSSNFSILF